MKLKCTLQRHLSMISASQPTHHKAKGQGQLNWLHLRMAATGKSDQVFLTLQPEGVGPYDQCVCNVL